MKAERTAEIRQLLAEFETGTPTGDPGLKAWETLQKHHYDHLKHLLAHVAELENAVELRDGKIERRNTEIARQRDLVAVLEGQLAEARKRHYRSEELFCGSWEHTNRTPGIFCPDCTVVCANCGQPWPCPDAEALGVSEKLSDE